MSAYVRVCVCASVCDTTKYQIRHGVAIYKCVSTKQQTHPSVQNGRPVALSRYAFQFSFLLGTVFPTCHVPRRALFRTCAQLRSLPPPAAMRALLPPPVLSAVPAESAADAAAP